MWCLAGPSLWIGLTITIIVTLFLFFLFFLSPLSLIAYDFSINMSASIDIVPQATVEIMLINRFVCDFCNKQSLLFVDLKVIFKYFTWHLQNNLNSSFNKILVLTRGTPPRCIYGTHWRSLALYDCICAHAMCGATKTNILNKYQPFKWTHSN